jgi:pyruvate dehydrogenase E2 component (dihydrolipoamide acetyltransferase)
MLGIKDAFVPFTPFLNVPVIMAVGQITDKPIARDGQVVIAPMLNINCTIDHRFVDGGRSKKILHAINDVFENPQNY